MNDFSDLVLTFTSEELSEHNKQIRADAIEECIDIVTDHNALILPLGYERIVNDMEQLKEQKNE